MNVSVIQYYGPQKDKCGYCKGTKCSETNGMHAYTMMPQDYQDLIDRGWRRSGMYCYKPNNKKTCCPCYTIKCDAQEFKMSKSHKKILKRMSRFLRDGKKDNAELEAVENVSDVKTANSDDVDVGAVDGPIEPKVNRGDVNLAAVALANPNVADHLPQERTKAPIETKLLPDNKKINQLSESSTSVGGPRKKAKQMRLERREAKLTAKGITDTKPIKHTNEEKKLSDYFQQNESDKHRLKLTFVHVKSKDFTMTLNSTFALYKKYQETIHNDTDNTVNGYLEFLQQSPLKHTTPADGPQMGYGSFHQQYWLDDQLIAVGVIDILPYCVSSVYFFYDPDYSFLSLGTYASLREIASVQELAETVPSLKYYYMGFYIHSCPKMRYKGKLSASYLLCPETYTWQTLTDEIRSKLDADKYQRLSTDPNERDANEFTESDLNAVLLLLSNNSFVPYGDFIQSFRIKSLDNMVDIIRSRLYKKITGEEGDRECIIEYGKLVGKYVAHRMLYWIES